MLNKILTAQELKTDILVGGDPEFFLFNTKTEMYESAHTLVPGTKDKPFKIPGGAVLCDGTAVEFNFEPARTKEEFVNNISRVLNYIRKKIPKQYEFRYVSTVRYPKDYWDSLPESCKESGCDPDYQGSLIRNPVKLGDGFAIAGGHIHISWNVQNFLSKKHFEDCVNIAGRAYFYLRLPTGEDGSMRNNYTSKILFRPKKYGIEYRSPSNSWLGQPDLWPKIFEDSQKLVKDYFSGKSVKTDKGGW